MALGSNPGHNAFASYLATFENFRQEDPAHCDERLGQGGHVLVHGSPAWVNKHLRVGAGVPWFLWHSGWAVTDLLNEQAALTRIMQQAAQGRAKLLWLHPSSPPSCAIRLPFAWDSASIRRLAGPPPAAPRTRCGVGLAFSPNAAKNTLVQVAAAAASGWPLTTLKTTASLTACEYILGGAHHDAWPRMPRQQFLQLLGGLACFCHASVAETAAYEVIEAIVLGVPVLLSPAIWVADLLEPSVRKLCVADPDDPDAMARILIRWRKEPMSMHIVQREQHAAVAAREPAAQEELRATLHKIWPDASASC